MSVFIIVLAVLNSLAAIGCAVAAVVEIINRSYGWAAIWLVVCALNGGAAVTM